MEPHQVQRGNLGAGCMLNENARRFCAEARQILLKDREERYKRNMAKAIAEGFSSLEEKRQHSMNKFEKAEEKHEKWMKEQAALADTTFEEFEGEHWAPQQFVPRYIGPTLPNCACDEHPIPFFCPRSLTEYSSQKLEKELPDFIANRHRLQIEKLQIEPDDPSKRLAHATLRREWARMPTTSGELPIWAEGDKVLQQIIHPSPPPIAQRGSSRGDNMPNLPFTVTGHEADTTPSIITPVEPSHNAGHDVQQVPRLSKSHKTRLQSNFKDNPKQRRRESWHRLHQGPAKISKAPKRSVPPAMRTRS